MLRKVALYVCPTCLKFFPKSPLGHLQRQETAGGDLTQYSDSYVLIFLEPYNQNA